MGWGSASAFGVHARLDEHGGDKEKRHQELWDEMEGRLEAAIKEIIAEPKYEEIRPEIW